MYIRYKGVVHLSMVKEKTVKKSRANCGNKQRKLFLV